MKSTFEYGFEQMKDTSEYWMCRNHSLILVSIDLSQFNESSFSLNISNS
ncbi:hypothetical protein ACDZ29_17770 [Peribacillus sp. RS7]